MEKGDKNELLYRLSNIEQSAVHQQALRQTLGKATRAGSTELTVRVAMTVFHQILGLSVVKVGNQVVLEVVGLVDGMIVLFVTVVRQDGNLTEGVGVDLLFLGKLLQEDVALFVIVVGHVVRCRPVLV